MSEHTAEKGAPKFQGAGTYINGLGAVMVVERFASKGLGFPIHTLGSIYEAYSPDDLFGSTRYLITPEGMEGAGYVKSVIPPGKSEGDADD